VSQKGSQENLSYAGFSEMNPRRNHFILVGDTQSTSHWEFWRERNDTERKLIMNEITRRDPAFVIHLGDLTTRGSSKQHWQNFDEMHKEFREKKIPYFPVLGNHEFYGNDTTALEYYFERFPHLERKRWYSFSWKNVGNIIVDSNFRTMTKGQIETQSRWYQSELVRFDSDDTIDSFIVCCHAPPFTNSKVIRANKKSEQYFADYYIQSRKGAFFFSGHAHTYERFREGGKSFIVSGGGGGPRHRVSVDSEKQRYKDFFNGPELRFFHFCEIEVRDKDFAFKAVGLEKDGTFSTADTLIVPFSAMQGVFNYEQKD
jgi:predicted phosphodiesterase